MAAIRGFDLPKETRMTSRRIDLDELRQVLRERGGLAAA
jgi:hypothetical protein